MKPTDGHPTCLNCSSACYHRPVMRVPTHGPKIDKLFYDKLQPLREKKCINRLIQNICLYNNVTTELISETSLGKSEKVSLKSTKHMSLSRKSIVTPHLPDKKNSVASEVAVCDMRHHHCGGPDQKCDCCSCYVYGQHQFHCHETSRPNVWAGKHTIARATIAIKPKNIKSDSCLCKISNIVDKGLHGKPVAGLVNPTGKLDEVRISKEPKSTSYKLKRKVIGESSCHSGSKMYSQLETAPKLSKDHVRGTNEPEERIKGNKRNIFYEQSPKYEDYLETNRIIDWACEDESDSEKYEPEQCIENLQEILKKGYAEDSVDQDVEEDVINKNRYQAKNRQIESPIDYSEHWKNKSNKGNALLSGKSFPGCCCPCNLCSKDNLNNKIVLQTSKEDDYSDDGQLKAYSEVPSIHVCNQSNWICDDCKLEEFANMCCKKIDHDTICCDACESCESKSYYCRNRKSCKGAKKSEGKSTCAILQTLSPENDKKTSCINVTMERKDTKYVVENLGSNSKKRNFVSCPLYRDPIVSNILKNHNGIFFPKKKYYITAKNTKITNNRNELDKKFAIVKPPLNFEIKSKVKTDIGKKKQDRDLKAGGEQFDDNLNPLGHLVTPYDNMSLTLNTTNYYKDDKKNYVYKQRSMSSIKQKYSPTKNISTLYSKLTPGAKTHSRNSYALRRYICKLKLKANKYLTQSEIRNKSKSKPVMKIANTYETMSVLTNKNATKSISSTKSIVKMKHKCVKPLKLFTMKRKYSEWDNFIISKNYPTLRIPSSVVRKLLEATCNEIKSTVTQTQSNPKVQKRDMAIGSFTSVLTRYFELPSSIIEPKSKLQKHKLRRCGCMFRMPIVDKDTNNKSGLSSVGVETKKVKCKKKRVQYNYVGKQFEFKPKHLVDRRKIERNESVTSSHDTNSTSSINHLKCSSKRGTSQRSTNDNFNCTMNLKNEDPPKMKAHQDNRNLPMKAGFKKRMWLKSSIKIFRSGISAYNDKENKHLRSKDLTLQFAEPTPYQNTDQIKKFNDPNFTSQNSMIRSDDLAGVAELNMGTNSSLFSNGIESGALEPVVVRSKLAKQYSKTTWMQFLFRRCFHSFKLQNNAKLKNHYRRQSHYSVFPVQVIDQFNSGSHKRTRSKLLVTKQRQMSFNSPISENYKINKSIISIGSHRETKILNVSKSFNLNNEFTISNYNCESLFNEKNVNRTELIGLTQYLQRDFHAMNLEVKKPGNCNPNKCQHMMKFFKKHSIDQGSMRCDPEMCLAGQCDPTQCIKKQQQTKSKTEKSVVQHKGGKNSVIKIKPSPRRMVRVDSDFSFNLEFNKGPPCTPAPLEKKSGLQTPNGIQASPSFLAKCMCTLKLLTKPSKKDTKTTQKKQKTQNDKGQQAEAKKNKSQQKKAQQAKAQQEKAQKESAQKLKAQQEHDQKEKAKREKSLKAAEKDKKKAEQKEKARLQKLDKENARVSSKSSSTTDKSNSKHKSVKPMKGKGMQQQGMNKRCATATRSGDSTQKNKERKPECHKLKCHKTGLPCTPGRQSVNLCSNLSFKIDFIKSINENAKRPGTKKTQTGFAQTGLKKNAQTQSDVRFRKMGTSDQQTLQNKGIQVTNKAKKEKPGPHIVEKPRFPFAGQDYWRGLRIGSNVNVNVEFYKEHVISGLNKPVKANDKVICNCKPKSKDVSVYRVDEIITNSPFKPVQYDVYPVTNVPKCLNKSSIMKPSAKGNKMSKLNDNVCCVRKPEKDLKTEKNEHANKAQRMSSAGDSHKKAFPANSNQKQGISSPSSSDKKKSATLSRDTNKAKGKSFSADSNKALGIFCAGDCVKRKCSSFFEGWKRGKDADPHKTKSVSFASDGKQKKKVNFSANSKEKKTSCRCKNVNKKTNYAIPAAGKKEISLKVTKNDKYINKKELAKKNAGSKKSTHKLVEQHSSGSSRSKIKKKPSAGNILCLCKSKIKKKPSAGNILCLCRSKIKKKPTAGNILCLCRSKIKMKSPPGKDKKEISLKVTKNDKYINKKELSKKNAGSKKSTHKLVDQHSSGSSRSKIKKKPSSGNICLCRSMMKKKSSSGSLRGAKKEGGRPTKAPPKGKPKAKPKPKPKPPIPKKPCVCGSKICIKESKRIKKLQMGSSIVPKAAGSCTCGSKICKNYFKNAGIENKKEKARRKQKMKFKKKARSRKKQLLIERKQLKIRQKKYKEQRKIRIKARKKKEKEMMKQVRKSKGASDGALAAESLLDIAKLGFVTVGDLLRSLFKSAMDPKVTAANVKTAYNEPIVAYRGMKEAISDSGVGSTLKRVKYRITLMESFKRFKLKLEENCLTKYIIHMNDKNPKKRLKRRGRALQKPLSKRNLNCNLYASSLRKRPCLAVYFFCPWFYPHCLSLLRVWKNMVDIMLFLMAIVVWCPCLFCLEALRVFMCCFVCTV